MAAEQCAKWKISAPIRTFRLLYLPLDPDLFAIVRTGKVCPFYGRYGTTCECPTRCRISGVQTNTFSLEFAVDSRVVSILAAFTLVLLIAPAQGDETARSRESNSLARIPLAELQQSAAPYDTELSDLRLLLQHQQQQLHQQATRIEQLESQFQISPARAKEASLIPSEFATGSGQITPLSFGCDSNGSCSDCKCQSYSGCCGCRCYPLFILGGQYRIMFNGANFDFHDATITDDQRSQSFFNQRFRTWLTIQTRENVEGYVQVEMGHIAWGENFEFPKTYVGPRFPPADDRVGIELRRGYLTYTSDVHGRWRVGIQDWQDSFDQTLASSDWDFNVGGLSWLTTVPALGNMRMLAGAFVLYEGIIGQADDALLWTVDGDWEAENGNKFGWSVHVVTDHDQYSHPTVPPYDSSWDMWAGIRGTLQTSLVPLHAFFIYNHGERDELGGGPDFEHSGFALKVETGPTPFWFGELRFQGLYSTGEDDPADRSSSEFRTVAQSVRDNFGAQGYWSYLAITSPHGPSDVNDLGVSLQNRGLGLFTAQAAFDYEINDCLSAVLSVGWLNSEQPNPTSDSRDMGTEVLKMFTYDFGGGLKADVGAAVLFTGDFYKPAPLAPSPDTLWEAFSRVQLEF